ncbi:MAG: radical SAM protein [Candidatus Heimdallarchaeota archaeon]
MDDPLDPDSKLLSVRHFGRRLRTYYPSDSFPSVSVTGGACDMACQYCNRKYLKHMMAATSPARLREVLLELHTQGALGCLISGGYTREGKVPLQPFLKVIREIKAETDLIINVHPGLVSVPEAEELAAAEVDIISADVVGHDKIVQDVIGLDASAQNYFDNLHILQEADLTVIPHIGLGFAHGTMLGVREAITASLAIKPSLLVFLILRPTKGTPMEEVLPPSSAEVREIFTWTRNQAPAVEQALGCMRPRAEEFDRIAFETGVNRIVLPRKAIVEAAREANYTIERYETCCIYPL